MEITSEIKTKVFAQYLGALIRLEVGLDRTLVGVGGIGDQIRGNGVEYFTTRLGKSGANQFIHSEFVKHSNSKLILRSISSLTEEHLIECAKICHISTYENTIPNFRESVKKIFESQLRNTLSFDVAINLYQFLTSQGYDTVHYLLEGKTLFECNLCIYE